MIKVSNFHNKNQFLIREDGKIIFQSYDSIIAIYDTTKKLKFGKNWDYSTTTLKHLYFFIDEFINNFEIREVLQKTNNRTYINKLIKNGIIEYDNELI